jgi:hypothetical protein
MLRGRAWVILAALALAGCLTDEVLNPPPPPVDAMFARYVAIGGSTTAGFQSLGINDSTQQEAFPVLLARQMGSVFGVPSLTMPGCPPPLVNIYTQERIDTIPNDCAARGGLTPNLPFISNVAVVGASVIDVYSNDLADSDPNPLTTFILGGRTQIDAARAASPTFVSVFVGNNDVLAAATNAANPGDPGLVTPPQDFVQRYAAMVDSLDTIGSIQGGILVGALQVAFVPFFTQGRVWKGFELQLDAQTAPLNFLDVSLACLDNLPIPMTTDTAWLSVPFSVGGFKLAEILAKTDSVQGGLLPPQNLVPVALDCPDTEAITALEMLNLLAVVTTYNIVIEAQAEARNWAFVDPNDLLRQAGQDTTAIRIFPALPPAPESVTEPFGWALSRDGIHPSGAAHRLIADALIAAINAHYSTSIPHLP